VALGDEPVIARFPGRFAVATLVLIATLLLAGLLPVALIGIGDGSRLVTLIDAYFLRVLSFTLLQASLSTLLSVGIAVPLARALARRAFVGRGLLLRLFALPLAMPAIVVILGIVQVYGQSGWLGMVLGRPLDIYGLGGILLAHVFFNMPLAIRILLARLEAVPAESLRLSRQLGLTPAAHWRHVEWPALREVLPQTASLVFLLCAASFAVVLTLGGGPGATTLEVAIYQALRFDFDPGRASLFAITQLLLSFPLALLVLGMAGRLPVLPAIRLGERRPTGEEQGNQLIDWSLIALGAVFVGAPILAVILEGVRAEFAWSSLGEAMGTSLLIAGTAAAASVACAWVMAQSAARLRPVAAAILDGGSLLGLLIPPAVLATGWFLVALRLGALDGLALAMVAAMNALMALPFTYAALRPASARAARQHDRLCLSLGISGWTRLRHIELPAMMKPLGLAVALGFAVSLGDLTAITLLGSQDLTTLPALIYRQMGSYRLEAAAGTALVLLVFTGAVTAAIERLR
jgi:thiamine transport system permease protein